MRLLLVEDDDTLAGLIARGLRAQAYAVDHVRDGDAAVTEASITPYDAIILDVSLPRRDGVSVCTELRRRGSDARVLMLTARDTVIDRVLGLDAGADDYLTKPFDFDELLARLRALLRRRGELIPTELVIGDLSLNTRGQTATRGGVPLALTTKEYSLLEYLARNAETVVGRADISDHVWDDQYDPFSNLIESYINRLRRKVDRPGLPAMIQTRRGAGYILTASAPPE